MGCGASKEVALSVHPTTAARSVTTPLKGATTSVDSTSADSPQAHSKHANAPASASTLKPAHFRSDAASKPSSAHPVDPTVRSDSGIGTRHSAGSSKSVLGAKPLLPSIPMGSSVVATNGAGASAAPAAVAVDDEALAMSASNTRATSAKPVMAFEIPLDDNVKVRSRKPTSAAPRNRKRTQLQPMVHLSNDEIMKKLKEAEQKWEDPESAIAKDKDLDPSLLRAIVADRDHRIAMNRQRELEEKKSKLQQHDAHMREVAERKMRILAQNQGPAGVGSDAAANDVDDVPMLRMSWGGASGSLHAADSGLPGSAHSSSASPSRTAVGPRGVTASLVPAFAVMDR